MCIWILFLLSLVAISKGINTNNFTLKQVFIISRHNIRTPMRPDLLSKYSPKKWPVLNQRPGQLTKKGALVESYLGRYFKQWFKSEKLLQNDKECSSNDTVYVYANSMNRTVETAEAFVESAFPNCKVIVHHKRTIDEEMDPIFSPIIHNQTEAFKERVLVDINRKLNNTKLKEALNKLNTILDIKNSEICKSENICDLTDMSKNSIRFENCEELWINGPMYVANTVLDAFSMSYYEGLPIEDVAWGLLTTPESWEILTEIGRQDQDIRYTTVADDIGAKLKYYISNYFLNYEKKPKIIFVVGHDFNQNTLMNSMGFEAARLPHHYDLNPIGGKIVFQRWTDNIKDFLKIEYIYPSWAQLRNGTEFSMENPPERVLLHLKWCNVDKSGFCPWSEFISKLSLMQ